MEKLKRMSGGCDKRNRKNYMVKKEKFTITFSPITAGNKLPDLSNTDGGTTRSIRRVSFESKFVDDIHDEKWKKHDTFFKR